MIIKLKNRNYPEELISEKFSEARKKPRANSQKRKETRNKDEKVRLIFTHNRGNPPLHVWLREAKQCLVKNKKTKLLGDKLQICYSQPKSLKIIITQKQKIVKPCEESWMLKMRQVQGILSHHKKGGHIHQHKYRKDLQDKTKGRLYQQFGNLPGYLW